MQPWHDFRALLHAHPERTVTLSIEQINVLLHGTLPSAAGEGRSWWTDHPAGAESPTNAWLAVGWTVDDVDSVWDKVTFIRLRRQGEPSWSDVFQRKPAHWGLRGDPVAWDRLHERLEGVPVPRSIEGALTLLTQQLLELLGIEVEVLEQGEPVYREELARGGMSSGQVALDVWKSRLLPMLATRVGDVES